MIVLKEFAMYTCGGVFVPSDNILHGTIGVQPNVTCLAPVSAHYYSSRMSFPLLCFDCSSTDVAEIAAELKARFQTVHPVCHDCRENSFKERTRGEKKLKK